MMKSNFPFTKKGMQKQREHHLHEPQKKRIVYPQRDITTDELCQAIYSINNHAKSATKNHFLYTLKQEILQKSIRQGIAKVEGIQVILPKRYKTVVVSLGQYHFHLPPKSVERLIDKKELQILPLLSSDSQTHQNPTIRIPLSKAKHIAAVYLGQEKYDRIYNDLY